MLFKIDDASVAGRIKKHLVSFLFTIPAIYYVIRLVLVLLVKVSEPGLPRRDPTKKNKPVDGSWVFYFRNSRHLTPLMICLVASISLTIYLLMS